MAGFLLQLRWSGKTREMGAMNDMPVWLQRILGREAHKPVAPEGLCIYAIGDIHGRLDLAVQLIRQIASHSRTLPEHKCMVFLGDYIDRGPDSRQVIDLLLDLKTTFAGWEIIYLRGNHDQAILDFLADPQFYRAWRGFGAQETLLSYGVVPPRFDDVAAFETAAAQLREVLPASHLAFFEGLQYSAVKGDYMFVHAGIRPGQPLDGQAPEDLLWIRDEFLFSNRAFGKVIVHGHTPTERPVQRHNRIGIDTGAHATDRLTAAVLRHDTCEFLVSTPATGYVERSGTLADARGTT